MEKQKKMKSKLTALPKWLRSKNDFKEAIKLFGNIGDVQIMLNQVTIKKF